MAIIDNTFFQKGNLYIPNNRNAVVVPVGSSVGGEINDELTNFINQQERLFFYNSLGVFLYNELLIEVQKQPFNTSSAETAQQKWIDLINGVDYELNGKTYRWEGLKGFEKNSVIAYFVKAFFLINRESVLTTVGSVKPDAQNANHSNQRLYNTIWNKFCKMYQGKKITHMLSVNYNNIFDYSGDFYYTLKLQYLTRQDLLINYEEVNVSFYQYLTDMNSIDSRFKGADFKFYRPSNVFGL